MGRPEPRGWQILIWFKIKGNSILLLLLRLKGEEEGFETPYIEDHNKGKFSHNALEYRTATNGLNCDEKCEKFNKDIIVEIGLNSKAEDFYNMIKLMKESKF